MTSRIETAMLHSGAKADFTLSFTEPVRRAPLFHLLFPRKIGRSRANSPFCDEIMAGTPTVIRAHKDAGVLELQWSGEPAHKIPFAFLRGECPCASCIDEFTGRLILDRNSIPTTIVPTAMGFVGNYAIKITWSDGHSTGLYTWDHLANVVGYFVAGHHSPGRQG